MRFRIYLVLLLAAALAPPRGTVAQDNPLRNSDLQASYDFLTTARAAGGVLFTFTNAAGNYVLPGSFYDTAAYWGAHVCERSAATCAINDTYSAIDYQLSPAPGPAGKMQVERVNAHNGANIYDAATWQIAVVLGFVKNKFRLSSTPSAYALARNLSEVLRQSGLPSDCSAALTAERARAAGKSLTYSRNSSDCNTAPGAKRAVTAEKTFIYNGSVIADGSRAYAFRTLAPEWLARDPLMDSPYASFISASDLPASKPAYQTGKITWTDWKPITGENAWAFLIGPLQAAHIHYVLFQKKSFVPFSDLAVQNALDVLPAFAAMQSAVGAVYYAPAGTFGNEDDTPVNPHEVSVENNLSLYAGLQILRLTLRAQLDGEATLVSAEKSKIKDALRLIDVMIDGGQFDANRKTKGLLSFFKNAAWQDGGFVQGGQANDPGQGPDWVPATATKAVDVQTWGIAALGAKRIDEWFGTGASFEMWQQLKAWGGYGVGKTLWGVGYSNHDGNGTEQNGAYRQGVMSAEWTAGAITAVRNMIGFYGADARTAKRYVESLRHDEIAMMNGLTALRIDRYSSVDFPGKPADYAELVPMKTKPYLYASRRYHIPFGWYANPLPSTAATAWVIMVANHFDPFGFGGAPN